MRDGDDDDDDKQTRKQGFDCYSQNWVELRLICFEAQGSPFQSRCLWGLISWSSLVETVKYSTLHWNVLCFSMFSTSSHLTVLIPAQSCIYISFYIAHIFLSVNCTIHQEECRLYKLFLCFFLLTKLSFTLELAIYLLWGYFLPFLYSLAIYICISKQDC